MNRKRKIGKILKNWSNAHASLAATLYFPGGYSWKFSKSWPYLGPENVIFYTSLRKQPTFHDATTGFPAKKRLKNEFRNSIMMTCHHPEPGSDSDRSYRVGNLIQPIRRTTQIWVETPWNFCARFSDVIWRGNQWHGRVAMSAVVSGWTRFQVKEIFSLLLTLERQQKRFLKTHFEFAYFSFFQLFIWKRNDKYVHTCVHSLRFPWKTYQNPD